MGWLLDEPSVVLLCVAIAAVLLVAEVALPTIGIAGTLGLAAAVAAVVAIASEDYVWWPLLGPAAAVVVWAVLVASRTDVAAAEVTAGALFAAGGVGFAFANDDLASALVTVAATGLLVVAFPRARRAASALLDRPSTTGMEGLVGKTAAVDRWEPAGRVVLLDGSRWNASTDVPVLLRPGDRVTVVGFHGNTVDVRPAPATPLPPTPAR